MMKRWVCILLLSLAQSVWVYPALAQGVNAFVDRDTVAEGETLRLVIEVTGNSPSNDPDWLPLSQDFQVLSTDKRNQFSITNGTMEAKTRWTVTLAPQKTGSLTIPALTVGDQQTQAIVIKVTEAGTASTTGATPDIFIESEVKPDTAYVQQQLTYVTSIYCAVTPHNLQLSDPKAADALIERLGDARKYETQRGGRYYVVFEQQYAIFPQSSGALSIESPIFFAQVPDTNRQSANNNFFGQGGFLGPDSFNSLFQTVRPVQVRGQPFQITVKPRPSNSGGGAWLPAENLTVTESWSTDPPTFRVGEPVTRTLTLKARGLTGAQLPELPLPSSADLKLYPDRSATDTQANTGVVVGQREQKIALVPTRPGTFQLPEIRIPWWDTQADAPREAVIPAHRIIVTGAPAPSTPAQSAPVQQQATKTPAVPVEPSADAKPEPQKTPSSTVKAAQSPRLSDTLSSGASYWFWIALALLIAWIATLLLWWRARSRVRAVSPSADEQEMGLSQREALRELKQACQANDTERTKKALLHWAKVRWPDQPPRSVLGIAERIDHQDARHALTTFDRCLYQDGGRSWNGEAFYRDVSDVLQAKAARMKDGPKGRALPELYPA